MEKVFLHLDDSDGEISLFFNINVVCLYFTNTSLAFNL